MKVKCFMKVFSIFILCNLIFKISCTENKKSFNFISNDPRSKEEALSYLANSLLFKISDCINLNDQCFNKSEITFSSIEKIFNDLQNISVGSNSKLENISVKEKQTKVNSKKFDEIHFKRKEFSLDNVMNTNTQSYYNDIGRNRKKCGLIDHLSSFFPNYKYSKSSKDIMFFNEYHKKKTDQLSIENSVIKVEKTNLFSDFFEFNEEDIKDFEHGQEKKGNKLSNNNIREYEDIEILTDFNEILNYKEYFYVLENTCNKINLDSMLYHMKNNNESDEYNFTITRKILKLLKKQKLLFLDNNYFGKKFEGEIPLFYFLATQYQKPVFFTTDSMVDAFNHIMDNTIFPLSNKLISKISINFSTKVVNYLHDKINLENNDDMWLNKTYEEFFVYFRVIYSIFNHQDTTVSKGKVHFYNYVQTLIKETVNKLNNCSPFNFSLFNKTFEIKADSLCNRIKKTKNGSQFANYSSSNQRLSLFYSSIKFNLDSDIQYLWIIIKIIHDSKATENYSDLMKYLLYVNGHFLDYDILIYLRDIIIDHIGIDYLYLDNNDIIKIKYYLVKELENRLNKLDFLVNDINAESNYYNYNGKCDVLINPCQKLNRSKIKSNINYNEDYYDSIEFIKDDFLTFIDISKLEVSLIGHSMTIEEWFFNNINKNKFKNPHFNSIESVREISSVNEFYYSTMNSNFLKTLIYDRMKGKKTIRQGNIYKNATKNISSLSNIALTYNYLNDNNICDNVSNPYNNSMELANKDLGNTSNIETYEENLEIITDDLINLRDEINYSENLEKIKEILGDSNLLKNKDFYQTINSHYHQIFYYLNNVNNLIGNPHVENSSNDSNDDTISGSKNYLDFQRNNIGDIINNSLLPHTQSLNHEYSLNSEYSSNKNSLLSKSNNNINNNSYLENSILEFKKQSIDLTNKGFSNLNIIKNLIDPFYRSNNQFMKTLELMISSQVLSSINKNLLSFTKYNFPKINEEKFIIDSKLKVLKKQLPEVYVEENIDFFNEMNKLVENITDFLEYYLRKKYYSSEILSILSKFSDLKKALFICTQAIENQLLNNKINQNSFIEELNTMIYWDGHKFRGWFAELYSFENYSSIFNSKRYFKKVNSSMPNLSKGFLGSHLYLVQNNPKIGFIIIKNLYSKDQFQLKDKLLLTVGLSANEVYKKYDNEIIPNSLSSYKN